MLSVIPAILRKGRRRVLETLILQGATRPSTAKPLTGLKKLEQRQLQRLLRQGVVREAEPGTFYVEEAIRTADREIRRLSLILVLLLLWVGFLLSLLFR